MKALALVVALVGLAGQAWADGQTNTSVRITATASSATAANPPWRAIGQITAERWGWCADRGDGVGESITFTFDDPLPITELVIVAGIDPDWRHREEAPYGLPERVEVTTDAQTVAATLVRGRDNLVALSGKPVRAVTLKVLAVNPGKVARTCVNSVNFRAAKSRYVAVYGFDAAAFQALPGFARALDAAFKTCDPTVLGASIHFPLAHEHDTIVMMGDGVPPREVTYKNVGQLVKACRRADSVLPLGLAGLVRHDRDVDVADDIAHPFSETSGAVRIGDWDTHAWWLAWRGGTWQLERLLTSEDQTDDAQATIAALAGDQFDAWNQRHDPSWTFTHDATLVLVEPQAGVVPAATADAALPGVRGAAAHHETDVAVTFARDRHAAVLSFVTTLGKGVEYRVSELVVRDDDSWKIAGGMWSAAKPNAAVNKAAMAATIAAFTRIAAPGAIAPAPLTDGFFAMQRGPIDATAAARKDLVVFGSGPKERTIGGARFAKPWAAAWANHVPLDASGLVGALAPTGATGWVATDIMLEKRTPAKSLYLIPFRLFLVFDRTLDGTWTLLHAHVATVAP